MQIHRLRVRGLFSTYVGKGKAKKKRLSKLSAMEMLQSKFEVSSGLRAKELELKKEKLDLMKRRMDREDEERKQAAEEREKRMQMEFEERKLMLDLLKKLLDKQ